MGHGLARRLFAICEGKAGGKEIGNDNMNNKTAYPLCWPDRRGRTPEVERRTNKNFKASFAIARELCKAEIRRLGGDSVIVSSNVDLKKNGEPTGLKWGFKVTGDNGVAVYFTRKGKQLCFACDRWVHVQDNMYAIALTIEALRGIARWGTGDMMEAAFTGYTALPERTTGNWWEVLGVAVNASGEQVKDAYRLLVKKHHPDTGGDAELFRRVQEAYQQFEKLAA
jgi:hypothetical protein